MCLFILISTYNYISWVGTSFAEIHLNVYMLDTYSYKKKIICFVNIVFQYDIFLVV